MNDSLGSLKGQLSNLTRQVLSEGLDDGEDNDTQVLVPRDHIKELESLCQLHKHELEECKQARAEVEERLHAADLHAAHQVNHLREQLHQREAELRELKGKSSEWGWDVEGSAPSLNHVPDHEWADGLQSSEHHNHHPHPQQSSKQVVWQEDLNQQLRRRVEELEAELEKQRDVHQHQVSTLQDHHRHHLLSLRHGAVDGVEAAPDQPLLQDVPLQSDDGLAEQASTHRTQDDSINQRTEQQKQLEREKTKLQNSVLKLQKQLQETTQKAEATKELEKKLSSLNEECGTLRKENERYANSLEELDNQHHEAIEQVLKQRSQIQEEARAVKEEHDQLAEVIAQLQANNHKQQDELQCLQAELLSSREKEVMSYSEFKEQLESLDKEKNDMKMQLDEKSTALLHFQGQLTQLCQERNILLSEKLEFEEELTTLREKVNMQCSQEEHSYKSEEELVHLQRKCEEEHLSNLQLTATVEELKTELEKLQASEAHLKELIWLSEEKENSSGTTNLNNQLGRLSEEMSKLSVTTTERDVLLEGKMEEEQKNFEEKPTFMGAIQGNLEQELQDTNHALEDAKARTGILESEVQAKVQEIAISNTTITELEAKLKLTENELLNLCKSRKEEVEEVKKALTNNNQEVPKNVKAGVHKLAELLRESVWQRDTLERHVSAITQELREKNEQLNEAETARTDLERECEDLRDQLEEVQKGVRPLPEGSSRGLPTIEEETEAGAEGDAEGEEAEGKQDIKMAEHREPMEQERSSEIEALQAQVEALSEARRNLETEVANMRAERETLQGQLREAEGRTGNMVNLETEAATLRGQKNTLEMQLASLTHQLDAETVTFKDERDTLRDQVYTLSEQLECLQAEMALSKHERDSIGQQLLNQYQVSSDRDATIRVLESELDGLKDTLREKFGSANSCSGAVAQFQTRETRLQEELDKVKSQLIFKKDKIDALSQVLEDIGQVFQIEVIDIDKVHKQIHSRYQLLEKDIKERDQRIEELSKKVNDIHVEMETYKKQNSQVEVESASRIACREKEVNTLKEQLEKSEMEVFQLREKVEELSGEINSRKQNALALQKKNEELTVNQEHQVSELSSMNVVVSQRNHEIEEKYAKITTLLDQIDQLEEEKSEMTLLLSERKELATEYKNLSKQEQTLREENSQLLQDKSDLLKENEKLSKEKQDMELAKNMAHQQLNSLQAEREQMSAAIIQKHQESVSYHAEIQRLRQVLTQTSQQSAEEKASLLSQLNDSETALKETRIHVSELRNELESLKKIREELQKNAAEGIVQKTEVCGLRKEMDSQRVKLSSLEQERDQLRIANAHFNTQYQDQSKELSTIREKESRLAVECERLRQHLITVEESYTTEALKAEERESTLRSTLTKMEEKLNNHSNFFNTANQRANVQVEALQEQLREMTAKRDDAVLRLHSAEEAAEQHQQSLATLQQVLQNFQKNQAREIAEATERTKRQLDEEQEKSSSQTVLINTLKAQLAEVQSGLAAASRLGEQLAKKEQMIVALKAQVTSQEEVARKARDEVVCLKSSSEGKVEKPLLRNLLVGYFATPADKRQEVLRIIAEVLDFSGEERSRTGLDTQGTSWLTSIANFLAPPASNVRVTSKVDVLDHTSLSQAFIRFLEDESNPRPQARLPAVQMAQQTTEKAEKKAQAKAQAKTQAGNKINPFISIGDTPASSTESSSRNSSPLLAAASSPPTLPTITPLESTSQSDFTVSNVVTPITVISTSGVATPVSTNKYLSNLLTSDPSEKADENANRQFS